MAFDIKNVDSITLPGGPGEGGGCSLKVHYKLKDQPHQREAKYSDTEFQVNHDPQKPSDQLEKFKSDMKAVDRNEDGPALFTVAGPGNGPDPVYCLFSNVRFGGRVWCIGIGAGNVLLQWKNKAQSVSCHNGGRVWLFAVPYGDKDFKKSSALVEGNVQNLKELPHGRIRRHLMRRSRVFGFIRSDWK
ncbi:MAG: hypothetical protein Q9217_004098 [Psora testacea]